MVDSRSIKVRGKGIETLLRGKGGFRKVGKVRQGNVMYVMYGMYVMCSR